MTKKMSSTLHKDNNNKKNLFWPTQSSLNAVYDNELNMHEHQGNFISLYYANPLVNNKTINNKTFVSVIYANPIFI